MDGLLHDFPPVMFGQAKGLSGERCFAGCEAETGYRRMKNTMRFDFGGTRTRLW